MSIDKESLRAHYEQLTDGDIERLANYQAGDLNPEALDILKDEIKRRGLSRDLDTAASIHARGVSEVEDLELIRKISSFPCPVCGDKKNHINGFRIMSVRGYIFITIIKKVISVGCPGCIYKSAKGALARNLLLGWWAIPSGPIRTIQSIFVNLKAANYDNYNEPTQEFIELIRPHSAALMARIDKVNDMEDVFKVIYPHDFD